MYVAIVPYGFGPAPMSTLALGSVVGCGQVGHVAVGRGEALAAIRIQNSLETLQEDSLCNFQKKSPDILECHVEP